MVYFIISDSFYLMRYNNYFCCGCFNADWIVFFPFPLSLQSDSMSFILVRWGFLFVCFLSFLFVFCQDFFYCWKTVLSCCGCFVNLFVLFHSSITSLMLPLITYSETARLFFPVCNSHDVSHFKDCQCFPLYLLKPPTL